ncbi:helix-turn-helix domain-containing protein [Nonomuraea dietziae]|uniref:helix-turn-helix domain-containing protein n=1 Tax=Nonomuraea dietziae TaxID=65515 RepID=UPI0033EE8007
MRAPASLGSAALETLDAYRTSGSRRRAADLLHVHHSSVARRLEQIGGALTDLPEPAGLVRAGSP